MIDHLSLGVGDLARSGIFYDKTLAALGYERLAEIDGESIGYGSEIPEFWLGQKTDATVTAAGFHLAFQATTRRQVDQFFKAALANGGHDDGKPGIRAQYHANYYAAFVLDPDGHRIEAVCHFPPD